MLPVIIPPQPQPVLDSNLFQTAWYLFLQAVKDAISDGIELIQYGPSADRVLFDATDLVNGSLWFETDTFLIQQWNAPTAKWIPLPLASANGATGTDTVGTVFAGGIATTVGAIPISSGPTSQTVTSNLIGTVYHNTSAKPRWVSISAFSAAVAATLDIFTDASNPPITQITHSQYQATPSESPVMFIVLPGNFYMAVGVNVTLAFWVEWE